MIEKICKNGNKFFINDNSITPTDKHQLEEEMFQQEKDFAGGIYYQRCLDRRNF